MSPSQLIQKRLAKLKHLASGHPFYSKVCKSMKSTSFDEIVDFVEEHGFLGKNEFAELVLRRGITDNRPRHKDDGAIAEVLLALKDPD
jgi:hypothetical protein